MTESERMTRDVGQAARIRQLLKERNEATMQFMRASRKFRMVARGTTVLHVVNPRSGGAEVTPLIEAAISHQVSGAQPRVISAPSTDDAKQVIEAETTNIRVVVIEADLDYPGEGLLFAKWLKSEHPDVPMLLATENEEDVQMINDELPYVDVFYSRTISTAQLMQLFGCSIS